MVKYWKPVVHDEVECSAQTGLVSDWICDLKVAAAPASGVCHDRNPSHIDRDSCHHSTPAMNVFDRIDAFVGRARLQRTPAFDRKSSSLREASVHIDFADSLKSSHTQHHREFRA